jgi:MFS family permease
MAAAISDKTAISGNTLERAVAQGVLTLRQVEMLRYLENTAAGVPAEAPVDDEKFRFINGFGDIFVTIGIALFLGALSYFAVEGIGGAGAGFTVALASWLLAEYFTRKRRMALPSIVLLLVYAASVFSATLIVMAGAEAFNVSAVSDDSWPVVIAGLATIAATALHYRRFRIPITFAAGVAALVASVLALVIAIAPDFAERFLRPVLLVCGIAVFALAMRFDLSDPQRQTRRTDIAFWLHMLAAPLVVHPLISGLVASGNLNAATSLGVLAIFLGLAAVAVLVDRRAILVSGLSYAGIAFGSLVRQIGLGESVVPLTLLVLGALVLLLSAGWHALRRRLFALLPAALVHRLPAHT